MLDRCSECGKRDWRVGYYFRWLFQPLYCSECGKSYWSVSGRSKHILKKHPDSESARFHREFMRYLPLVPLTVLMKKMAERSKEDRSSYDDIKFKWLESK